MRPLFAIDIGNSTTGIGLFGDCSKGQMVQRLSLSTNLLRDGNREGFLKEFYKVFGDFLVGHNRKLATVVSSVVPEVNGFITERLHELSLQRPLFINHRNNRILNLKIKTPEKIGSDRIATTAGAYTLYGGPLAVLDFGTATTISIVDKEGSFLGGAIMPGMNLMLDSLRGRTAQLPLVYFQDIPTPLGTDTVSAILSGVVIGTAGAVERIIGDIEKVCTFKLQLILTGGHAEVMRPYLKRSCRINPNLIYEGLRQIYLRQRK